MLMANAGSLPTRFVRTLVVVSSSPPCSVSSRSVAAGRPVPAGEHHPICFSDLVQEGVSVAESAVVPPGPIPNPVVTHGSAGEYCGGDPVGGEAAAGTPS